MGPSFAEERRLRIDYFLRSNSMDELLSQQSHRGMSRRARVAAVAHPGDHPVFRMMMMFESPALSRSGVKHIFWQILAGWLGGEHSWRACRLSGKHDEEVE